MELTKDEIKQIEKEALAICESNVPDVLNELLNDFALEHTYPVRGVIIELASKIATAYALKAKELVETIEWALNNTQSVFVFNELHKALTNYNKNNIR